MTDTTTAHQLYPLARLADMDDADLRRVQGFALADAADTAHGTAYAGMDRADTVATARRSAADVAAHLNYRAAMAFNRQATLDLLHAQALADNPGELNRRAVISYAGAPSATATAANILRELRGE